MEGSPAATPVPREFTDKDREELQRKRMLGRANTPTIPRDLSTKKRPRAHGRIASPSLARRSASRSVSAVPVPVPAKSTKTGCPNAECDGTEKDFTNDENGICCTKCGYVVSDSQIAQDPTFQEASNGAAQLLGTHIGAEQTHARSAAGVSRVLNDHDSANATSTAARLAIRALATNMRMNDDDVARAHKIWTLIHKEGQTKGREKLHVSAVCLYIAGKFDANNTMLLIDFAEKCDVNVFYLGRIYQDFRRVLGLRRVEAGDQRLYEVNAENLIHRYCQDLDFGRDEFRIASEAVQIFRRMDRDWMTTGRRPSGLCGAAVILAARMNNYRRTVREVVYTARVCEVTINQRLDEFKATAAGKLKVSDFRQHVSGIEKVDYEKKGDDGDGVAVAAPPAFYKQHMPKVRKRKRGAEKIWGQSGTNNLQAVIDNALDSASSGDDDSAEDTEDATNQDESHKSKRAKESGNQSESQAKSTRRTAEDDKDAMPPPPPPIDPALLAASNEAYANIGTNGHGEETATSQGQKDGQVLIASPQMEAEINNLEAEVQGATNDPAHVELAQEAHRALSDKPLPELDPSGHEQEGRTSWNRETQEPENIEQALEEDEDAEPIASWTDNHPDLHYDLVEAEDGTRVPLMRRADGTAVALTGWTTTASLLAKQPDTALIPEDEFKDDPAVEHCLLDNDEQENKERIWLTKYGTYLRTQHLKKIKRLMDEQNGVVKTRAKRNKPRLGDISHYQKDENGNVAKSMGEAYQLMWHHRGPAHMSKKINWDRVKAFAAQNGAKDLTPSESAGRSPTPASAVSHTPGSIFGEGELILKPKPKSQPKTREGRELRKQENAERRAARQAEKEEQTREREEARRKKQEVAGQKLSQLQAQYSDHMMKDDEAGETRPENAREGGEEDNEELEEANDEQMRAWMASHGLNSKIATPVTDDEDDDDDGQAPEEEWEGEEYD